LEIVAQAVIEAGLTLENVVRTRVMLTDMSRWSEAARAHGEMFSAIRPACTFVEVKGFHQPGVVGRNRGRLCRAEHWRLAPPSDVRRPRMRPVEQMIAED